MLQKIRETCYSGFEAGAVVVFVLPPSQEFICEPLLGVRGVGPFHPQDEPSLSIRHVQWRLRCGQHRRRHMQLQRRTYSCTDAQGAPHGASKTPTQAWNLEPAVLAFERFFDLVEGHRRPLMRWYQVTRWPRTHVFTFFTFLKRFLLFLLFLLFYFFLWFFFYIFTFFLLFFYFFLPFLTFFHFGGPAVAELIA